MADQLKVILWCMPRTLSTAFLKCMSSIPDSQMIFELYSTAMLFGPDKQASSDKAPPPPVLTDTVLEQYRQNPASGYPTSICSNQWVKHHLETGYPDKRFVFAKEMATSLLGQYHILPEGGYHHAFLIRRPEKIFPSWKKLTEQVFSLYKIPTTMEQMEFDKMPPAFMPPGKGFKEMYDLHSYVKESGLDPDPVIIDADDILSDPATVLSGFCKKLGIPYLDSMLTWDEGAEVVEKWVVSQPIKYIIQSQDGFKNFRNSTGFVKPKVKGDSSETNVSSGTSPDVSPDVSADIQRLIDFAMPYYTKMYQQRLK